MVGGYYKLVDSGTKGACVERVAFMAREAETSEVQAPEPPVEEEAAVEEGEGEGEATQREAPEPLEPPPEALRARATGQRFTKASSNDETDCKKA